MRKLKKDDLVESISGKDKGKRGKIIKVFPGESRVIAEGINMVKKSSRPTRSNPKGGIIQRENPVQISNLMLICPKCGKKARAGFTILTDGTKRRICKKCKELI